MVAISSSSSGSIKYRRTASVCAGAASVIARRPSCGELDHGSAGIVGARASADESPLLHSDNQV